MPKITSAKQYGLIAAAASGKATKATGLSQGSASKMLHETPPAKRSAYARALAKKRKSKGRMSDEHRAFAGR